MRDQKLFKTFTSASVVLLVSTLAVVEKAEAWSWYGFSALCVEGEAKGPEGSVIEFELKDVIVRTQCFNTNTLKLDQSGVGNAGDIFFSTRPEADPDKEKGVVSFGECISIAQFGDHNEEFIDRGTHEHICQPDNNKNKEEVLHAEYILEFVVEWWWKKEDKNGRERIIEQGTDTCVYPEDAFITLAPGESTGEKVNNYPVDITVPKHDEQFNCIEEVFKKVR